MIYCQTSSSARYQPSEAEKALLAALAEDVRAHVTSVSRFIRRRRRGPRGMEILGAFTLGACAVLACLPSEAAAALVREWGDLAASGKSPFRERPRARKPRLRPAPGPTLLPPP